MPQVGQSSPSNGRNSDSAFGCGDSGSKTDSRLTLAGDNCHSDSSIAVKFSTAECAPKPVKKVRQSGNHRATNFRYYI